MYVDSAYTRAPIVRNKWHARIGTIFVRNEAFHGSLKELTWARSIALHSIGQTSRNQIQRLSASKQSTKPSFHIEFPIRETLPPDLLVLTSLSFNFPIVILGVVWPCEESPTVFAVFTGKKENSPKFHRKPLIAVIRLPTLRRAIFCQQIRVIKVRNTAAYRREDTAGGVVAKGMNLGPRKRGTLFVTWNMLNVGCVRPLRGQGMIKWRHRDKGS